jgi:uncharacterized protein (TIGR03435 family)
MSRVKLLAMAVFLTAAGAQTPAVFEVASVKPIAESVGYPPRRGYWVEPRMDDPQRFRALTYVEPLIEWAYRVRDFQVVGGPQWIRDVHSRFDIQAMAPRASTRNEMRQMAQALLSDRFQLKVHRESKELAVYALVAGKSGPKLPAAKDVPDGDDDDGAINIGQGRVIARGVSMATLVRILSENLERPAIDRTNLSGRYDFTLNYDPNSLPDWRLGPALFSMVQDIGLKLEARKEMVEMIVVDSIEQPSGN